MTTGTGAASAAPSYGNLRRMARVLREAPELPAVLPVLLERLVDRCEALEARVAELEQPYSARKQHVHVELDVALDWIARTAALGAVTAEGYMAHFGTSRTSADRMLRASVARGITWRDGNVYRKVAR